MNRIAILAAFGCGLLGSAALAQPSPPAGAPPASPPSLGGRQFPSGDVERQVRATGDGAAAERDRRQLQELNDISRQLTPPGTPVPAPQVDPSPQRR